MSNEIVLEFFEAEEEEQAYGAVPPVAPPPLAPPPVAPPVPPPPLAPPPAHAAGYGNMPANAFPAPPGPPPVAHGAGYGNMPANAFAPPPVPPPVHHAPPPVPPPPPPPVMAPPPPAPAPPVAPLGVAPPEMRKAPLPPRPVAPPPFNPAQVHAPLNPAAPPMPPANRPDPAHVSAVRAADQMHAPAVGARHQWDLLQVGTREARNDAIGHVKMLADPARYQVVFKEKKVWRQERQPPNKALAWQPLDTATVYAHFLGKPKHQFHEEGGRRVKPEKELPHALFGKNAAGQPFHEAQPQKFLDWFFGSLIWVAAAGPGGDVTFYSHIGKSDFHHSSLVSGHGVVGAGEWIVEEGRILRISGNSGHYRPTIFELYRAVLRMMPALVTGTTTVFLYDTGAKDWVYIPIADFLADHSRGGRLKSHPESK